MPVPFRAMGTDLERRVRRWSLPGGSGAGDAGVDVGAGVVEPVEKRNRLVVDGGLARNLPVDTVRKLCKPDVVLVVNRDAGAESGKWVRVS